MSRSGRIDVLVNNAGNFYAGYFENIGPAQFRAQMETNFFGPLNVTRAVLPVPPRFVAGADVMAGVERNLTTIQGQIDAHRNLSASLAHDT